MTKQPEHHRGVVQACLLTAGTLFTTLAGLVPALVDAGGTALAIVVTALTIPIAGVLTVAALHVWRGGR